MDLRYTPIKKYVHTVEAVINHHGLRDRIQPINTKPFNPETPLAAYNPLGTVPTLVVDDGQCLFGGPVIYEYLDANGGGPPLYPDGEARWQVLRQAWMADGLFDASVKLIIEGWEDRETQRGHYIARHWAKITRALDWLERDAADFPSALDIGQMRAVGAIAFLALKQRQIGSDLGGAVDPAYDWRAGRPALSAWYDRVSELPSFTDPLIPWDELP